jgi:hypothetical protein
MRVDVMTSQLRSKDCGEESREVSSDSKICKGALERTRVFRDVHSRGG